MRANTLSCKLMAWIALGLLLRHLDHVGAVSEGGLRFFALLLALALAGILVESAVEWSAARGSPLSGRW
jgi:hypothetical protein